KIQPDLNLVLITFEYQVEEWGGELLSSIFDEVHYVPLEKFGSNFMSYVDFSNSQFDFIDLQYHQCGALIGACKERWPKAVIAFSPMESMVRGLKTSLCSGARGVFRFRQMAASLFHCFQEIGYVRRADRVITVSVPDRNFIAFFKPTNKVFCIPTALSEVEFPEPGCKKNVTIGSVVVFFAFFGSKTNRESLIWYCRNVHSKLRAQVTNYKLRVVGRGLDSELLEMCHGDGIEFLGEVEFIENGLSGAAIGIAPALGGAGVRGKIHQYSILGIPSVVSPLACEGLDYKDGESVMVADDASAFIDACTMLLNSPSLRDQIGSCARQVCLERYTWASMKSLIVSAYGVRVSE
ncbi:glycosyltransferase, partial [Pseudomonas protegens]|uniref:glycosyltransferase n=1 Tax=Pseudomonas protegens TaxID=380021 RepID=UPI00160E2864